LARRALAATLLLLLCGSASAQQEDLAIEYQRVARHVRLHRPPEAALLVKFGYDAKAEKRLAAVVNICVIIYLIRYGNNAFELVQP
jgi:hypothetical protein